MKGKLNIFQKTMLMWNDVHPYNAVDIIKIPLKLDEIRIEMIIKNHLMAQGLTNLRIDRRCGRYEFLGGQSDIDISIIKLKNDQDWLIDEIIENELADSFDYSCLITPFRFKIVDCCDYFILVVTYFHVISGEDSIALIINEMIKDYVEQNNNGPIYQIELYRTGGWSLFMKILKHCGLIGFIAACFDVYLKQSFKVKYRDFTDNSTGYRWFNLEPCDYEALIFISKRWKITINDLFISIMLKSTSHLSSRRFSEQRRKLSIASIVNLRKDLNLGHPRIMGVFLGLFVVSHEVPTDLGLKVLAGDINARTKFIKKHKIYLLTAFKLSISRLAMIFYSWDRKQKFYPKYHPLWGGITNININSVWEQEDWNIHISYLRAVSTGPATPLVFAFTTLGEKITVGISYRKTVFSETDIDSIINEFRKTLLKLE